MTELNENLRVAHEQGFGPTEDDVRRFQEYQREVSAARNQVGRAGAQVQGRARHHGVLGGQGRRLVPQQRRHRWAMTNGNTAKRNRRVRMPKPVRGLGGVTQMSRSAHRREMADMERNAPGIMQNREATQQHIAGPPEQQQRLVGNFGWSAVHRAHAGGAGPRPNALADIQKQIEQLQEMLDAAEQATRRTDLRAGKEETDRLRARFFGTHEGMEKAYSDAKKDVERLPETALRAGEAAHEDGSSRFGQEASDGAGYRGAMASRRSMPRKTIPSN